MLIAIARKEFREIFRDGRFRWLAAACLLLTLVAALSGWQSTLLQLREHGAAEAAERSNFLAQGARNPHAAAHFGQYAFRPVLLPAALDPGVGDYMGSMIWLEAHRQNLPEFRPAEDDAGFGRATRLSVAWVLQFLVPLFIIVTTFSAVAGERERGTLGLALSQGPGLPRILLGKTIAATGSLLSLLLPLILLSVWLFSVAAPEASSRGAAGRLACMALAYVLYLLGFAGLSLLVSTLSRYRRNAFFILVGAWLLITVVVPHVAADLASSVHRTPSPTEFWSAIREGEGAVGVPADPQERVAALRREVEAELLTRYDVDSVSALPVNFTAVFLQRLEDEDAPIFDYNFGSLWETYEAQRRFQRLWSGLSPAIAVRAVSMAMAGTDPFAQHDFSRAAEAHRRDFVRQLNELQATEGAGKRFYIAPDSAWKQVPALSYAPPGTREVIARHVGDLWILLLWAVVPFIAAVLAARRVRPTA